MIPREKSNTDESDITKRVVGKTKKGKELVVDQNTLGYFFIKFTTGGQLPSTLSGKFTNYDVAERAIESYLAGK